MASNGTTLTPIPIVRALAPGYDDSELGGYGERAGSHSYGRDPAYSDSRSGGQPREHEKSGRGFGGEYSRR